MAKKPTDTIRITNRELDDSYMALQRFSKLEPPAKGRYAIAVNFDKVQRRFKTLMETCQSIHDRFAKTGADGKVVTQTVAVRMDDKVVTQQQPVWTDPVAHDKEIADLMKLEIDILPHKISHTDLGDYPGISIGDLATLNWFIGE